MYEEFLKVIDEQAERLMELSDAIWEHPETAFSEYDSSKLLIDYLKEEGFQVNSPAYGIETAFTASFGSGGPTIGLLGEFDALAGLSQISHVFEKKPLVEAGNGHGCGHNLLGVGSLAAALVVKAYLEETKIPGTVIYYGCPGEEGGSGKAFMAREGAFEAIDCALSWHPSELNQVIQHSSLANLQVLYQFAGTSAHAAANPEDGRSALDALELMNVGVNFLREHMISGARIHYAMVNTGGFSPNVVQSYAEGLYLIRAPRMDQVKALFERINKVAEGMALATETKVSYEIIKSCANLIPNRTLEKVLYRSMQEVELPQYQEEDYNYAKEMTRTSTLPRGSILEKYRIYLKDRQHRDLVSTMMESSLYDFILPYEEMIEPTCMGGSTDVGDVSWQCPTAQIETATWVPNSGGHSWQIVAQGKGRIAHKAMLYCGKVLGLSAIKLINHSEILKAAQDEFKQTLEEKYYEAIPDYIRPRSMDSFHK